MAKQTGDTLTLSRARVKAKRVKPIAPSTMTSEKPAKVERVIDRCGGGAWRRPAKGEPVQSSGGCPATRAGMRTGAPAQGRGSKGGPVRAEKRMPVNETPSWGFTYTSPSKDGVRIKNLGREAKANPKRRKEVAAEIKRIRGEPIGKTKSGKDKFRSITTACQRDPKTTTTCPVQLVFERGTPELRFCTTKGEAGRLVRFGSRAEATARANELCKCWRKQGKATVTQKVTTKPGQKIFDKQGRPTTATKKGQPVFDKDGQPVMVKGRSTPANWVDNCGLSTAPLGGLKRKRRRR